MPKGLGGLQNDCAVGGGSEAGEASGGVSHIIVFYSLIAPRSIFDIPATFPILIS